MTEDDDFWSTWIATTPEQDDAYRGCGGPMLVIGGFVLLVIVLAWLAQ